MMELICAERGESVFVRTGVGSDRFSFGHLGLADGMEWDVME